MQGFRATASALPLLILLTIGTLRAAPVLPERARTVAVHALNALRSGARLSAISPEAGTVSPLSLHPTSKHWLYLVTFSENGGFVLVSGDDVGMPLLGYALAGSAEPGAFPPNLRKWLASYSEQIRRTALRSPVADPATRLAWSRLEREDGVTLTASPKSAGPLLTTEWNQLPYYNSLCPYDKSTDRRAVAGCVATAMAQVMKFWNYPEQGTGFTSYPHNQYGTLSANFSSTYYQWGAMPSKVDADNSAVATLVYHCGVSVETSYGPEQSGAWLLDGGLGLPCTELSMKRFFGYDTTTLKGLARLDYSTEAWTAILREELDAGRPIIYDGVGGNGGHCFVCDGYQNVNYFHMNWGWGGSFNGYFLLDALNPAGAGGNSDDYSVRQEALIGIQPPEGARAAKTGLVLGGALTLNTGATTPYSGEISLSVELVNGGASDFHGDICAAAFDAEGALTAFLGTEYGREMGGSGSDAAEPMAFDTSGLFALTPGNYTVKVLSRPAGGEWSPLRSTPQFANAAHLTVTNAAAIALGDSITVVNKEKLDQSGKFEATATLYNGRTTAFRGAAELRLYTLDGRHTATIGTVAGLVLNPGERSSAPLRFALPSLGVEPGTYLAALFFTEEPGTEAQLVGDGIFSNPVRVVVQAPELLADRYEPNNEQASAATLLMVNGGSGATTDRASIHTDRDNDWYRVVLPPGHRYSVTAQVYDSYTDPSTYTNDVVFSAISGADTSDLYDTQMPEPLLLDGGETVYFHVAPYTPGTQGTYSLYVEVAQVAGIEEGSHPTPTTTTTLPNPARGEVTVSLPSNAATRSARIVNAAGATVRTLTFGGERGELRLPVAGLPSGWYTVVATTSRGLYRAPFLKIDE